MSNIDWKHFEENVLATFGREMSLEMVSRYLDNALKTIHTLEKEIEKRDHLLHTLIGSSRSIGAYRLAELAVALRTELENNTHHDIDTFAIKGLTLSSVEELKEYCLSEVNSNARQLQ